MELGGRLAVFIFFNGGEPEPREPARALMTDIALIILGHVEDLVACCAKDVKLSASVALADIVDERFANRGLVTVFTQLHQPERNFGISVPEYPSILAPRPQTAGPCRRVKVLKVIEGYKADADSGLSASLGCLCVA